MKVYPNKILLSLLALFAGGILPFAFAPFGVSIFAILSPAILLYVWIHSSPKEAFLRGFLFGLGFFSIGIYWVYISIYVYGNASLFLAIFLTFLLVMLMSLYIALQGYLLNKIFTRNTWYKFLLAFPFSWVIFELVRGSLFGGFPWLYLGYSQIDTSLRGFAPIFGVWGVSYFVAFSAACIVGLFIFKTRKTQTSLIASLLFVWIFGWLLTYVDWTSPSGKDIKISLIQGNIRQEVKWQRKQLSGILNHYHVLTKKVWRNSEIIIWPEAAIPAIADEVKPYLNRLNKEARKHKTALITGIPLSDKNEHYYNGIIALGTGHGEYFKRHLVPFGEYIPLQKIFNIFFKWFAIPMSNFSAGFRIQPDFIASGIVLAPFICYEIAYPSLVVDYMPKAGLLVTVSDDSWFDRSIALAQQLEIARMRSLEVGRYQAVTSNTGFTAIIDARGRVIADVPPFDEYILTGSVVPMSGSTPFVHLMRIFNSIF
jgi:apolipoprotein N-acyltransferase